jgi:hypothetical protein
VQIEKHYLIGVICHKDREATLSADGGGGGKASKITGGR